MARTPRTSPAARKSTPAAARQPAAGAVPLSQRVASSPQPPPSPKRTVLVLQGGGALGAYQVGVYQALHEAGMEPDWVIGTSIGAINAALIVGNRPADRLAKLDAFWQMVEQRSPSLVPLPWPGLENWLAGVSATASGIPGFFAPNPAALQGPLAVVGVEAASYYSTTPLHETLEALVDFKWLHQCDTRLTVGAVNACSGTIRYFDSSAQPLEVAHIMASGALPPAFPAVRIGGEPYWDGGLYSNTPIEAVFDDPARVSSLIFSVNVWQQQGPEPGTIAQVLARQKDIQYASRDESHIARQQQLHRLRRVIRELHKALPDHQLSDPLVQQLVEQGCSTTMQVVRLLAPRLDGEDMSKDIDFSVSGIRARRQAGYADTLKMLAEAPWKAPVDPMEAVVVYQDVNRR